MTHDKFVTEVEGYLRHIKSAYGYLDAYEAIITALYNDFDKLNLSPGFFTVARCSLYNSLLMELSKLYCTRKNSSERTLSKLLNLLQENRHLFKPEDNIKELIENARAKLDAMEPEIKKLMARRDTYLAHNDPISFSKDFNPAKEYPLGIGAIVGLISVSEDLCLSVFSCLDERQVCIRATNSGDLDRVLKAVTN